MQPTHIQQSELNAANLAAHAQASAAAQAAASSHGQATPRAARGNIPAASAETEPTDPYASVEQASDPGDNLTFISDATELQQREHQREHGDLVRLQQELKQEKERAAKLAAERDQEHKLRQEAKQGEVAASVARIEAQRVADAKILQLQQERDARPTVAQLQTVTAERDARPTPERLTAVSGELAGKAAELNVLRARMETAELKAKQSTADAEAKIALYSVKWADLLKHESTAAYIRFQKFSKTNNLPVPR